MPLTLSPRIRDNVFVLQCEGQLVLGDETKTFESRLESAAQEFCHFVLLVPGLTRIDSSGVGLLVRWMTRLRRRGGDLRLAAPQPALEKLLKITRLAGVLRSFPTEEAAAFSYADEEREAARDSAPRQVIVVDRSSDFGAFVQTILEGRGYEVRQATFLQEVRTLLRCRPAHTILLGPAAWTESARGMLQTWAPGAVFLELSPEFRDYDALRGAEVLLAMFEGDATPA